MLNRNFAVSNPQIAIGLILLVMSCNCSGSSDPDLSGDTWQGDQLTGDALRADGAPGDSSQGDSGTGDSEAGDSASGDAHSGDAHAGDATTGDAMAGDMGPSPGDALMGDADAGTVSIQIANAGFEIDTLPNGNPIPDNTYRVDPNTPTSWLPYDPSGVLNGGSCSLGVINPTNSTFFPAGAPEGSLAALTFLECMPGMGEAGIQQTLSETLATQTRYTLRVEVGNIASGAGSTFSSGGTAFFDLDGFPGYRIELLAGGVVLGSDTGATIGEGLWDTRSVTVTIGASHPQQGQALSIRLINLQEAGTATEPGIEVDFDDVRLDATPAP